MKIIKQGKSKEELEKVLRHTVAEAVKQALDVHYEEEEECRACIDKTPTSEVPKYVDTKIKTNGTDNDKTFDIVDAFMHLIWGRKVRMTTWAKDEYIMLTECGLLIGEKWVIRNNGKLFPAEKLFDKDSIEARWEDYKEEL